MPAPFKIADFQDLDIDKTTFLVLLGSTYFICNRLLEKRRSPFWGHQWTWYFTGFLSLLALFAFLVPVYKNVIIISCLTVPLIFKLEILACQLISFKLHDRDFKYYSRHSDEVDGSILSGGPGVVASDRILSLLLIFSWLLLPIMVLPAILSSFIPKKSSEVSAFEKEHGYQTVSNEIFLYQNAYEEVIPAGSESIMIDRKPFSIRFFNKRYNRDNKDFYAARIAAFIDDTEFSKIQVGKEIETLSPFLSGTGLAGYEDKQYEFLYFLDYAHQYTFYHNEDDKRLTLIEAFNGYLKLAFDIKGFYFSDVENYPIVSSQIPEIYFVLLIDRNLNNVIDEGELNKFKIIFK